MDMAPVAGAQQKTDCRNSLRGAEGTARLERLCWRLTKIEGKMPMLYELRVYEAMPGRLPDLNKRFETVTLKIWEKHGIRQVGFWTAYVGESNQQLLYLLEWKDLAERERVWNTFQSD